ncbi:hypothetical protein [Microvirga pudoricolor]|uniref:hypothetical protein n=1 Tax=Microvirga pudoricolor TaxID=2778729 RepID=UPI00195277DF|nr:hypothetical protein [Microvirga pudoricolor]MBM6594515.1 hypothetical protein [Microvirga pudoricolor]
MKTAFFACLTIAALTAGPAFSADAVQEETLDAFRSQAHSEQRTYYREHRLRAYSASRAGLEQGATCVTEKLVCWIAEPLSSGDACSCASRRFGTLQGLVGG